MTSSIVALYFTCFFLITTRSSFAQNCDFSEQQVSDCQWQAIKSEDSPSGLQWQIFDEAAIPGDQDDDSDDQNEKTPSSLLTRYALLRFGLLFNSTRGKSALFSTSISPFLRCLTFWYRANASPFAKATNDLPNTSSGTQMAVWPTFRLKLVGGNEGPGLESDTTLLYTLPLQPGSIDGDRWQFRELSIPNVKTHYRVLLEVEIPKRVLAGYVAIDNIAFQARCDAGLHASYSMWPGNCRGNFIMDWGEPAGCRRCSLEECAVMCDSFSNCDGFSYATSGGAIFAETPHNYQCYLKHGGCSQLVAELPYSYFAKSGRHGGSTPKPVINRYTTQPSAFGGPSNNNLRRTDDDDDDNGGRGQFWEKTAPPSTTKRSRWLAITTPALPPTPAATTRRTPIRIISMPPGPLASGGALIIPAVFDDRYEQLDGNCGGNFLFRNGLRVGCQGCSLEECKQLCSKFEATNTSGGSRESFGSRCLGFSYTGRADVEPRCLLKSMNYCVPSYNTLGYFFYRKIIEARQHKEENIAATVAIPLQPAMAAELSNSTTLATDAI